MESPYDQICLLKKSSESHEAHSNLFDNSKLHEMMNQVECLIQHQYSIFVPAIVLKYKIENKINNNKEKDFYGWDYDDLFEFLSNFGLIENLEIASNIAIILFKTFVDAYTCKEYLQNSSNFKESEKNNFSVDWYKREDEAFISDIFKEKLKKIPPSKILDTIQEKSASNNNANLPYLSCSNNYNYCEGQSNPNFNYILENSNLKALYNNPNSNTSYNLTQLKNEILSNSNEQIASSFNAQYNYFASWCLSPNARNEFNTILNNQPIYNINYNKYGYDFDEGKNYNHDKNLFNGKYTCKFEIQIENDNEFQVARRLIGAKGCNMKRIIELCSRNFDGKYFPDAVKLRLRGKGSGYKEGPYNRESDEMLHLCISSKFYDKYKRACNLAQELIINVYEEFKRFCERNGRVPNNNLTIHKEENISCKKNSNNQIISNNNYYHNSDYFSSDS